MSLHFPNVLSMASLLTVILCNINLTASALRRSGLALKGKLCLSRFFLITDPKFFQKHPLHPQLMDLAVNDRVAVNANP
jgi:hypothetical protein